MTMTLLFELIVKHVPPPSNLNRTTPFSILTVQLPYVGMLLFSRVHSGILKHGDMLWALHSEGNNVKVKKIFERRGLERIERVLGG